jgi:NADPH2:quinone reductase
MVTMKTVRFHTLGDPDVLRFEAVARPEPGPGQVLVKVEATGINFADVVRRRGDPYPVPSPLPYTLGGECVGVVEAVGEGADATLVGKRMFAFPGAGCYAEYVLAPTERLFAFPKALDPVAGISLFVQGLTAALILQRAGRMTRGETVFVQGAAGGVGFLAIQLAKVYGAGMVIGAASSPAKRELVLAHGADLAVDYTASGWPEEIRAATGGRGVDLVLEMTGGEVGRQSFKLLAPFGRSIVYGVASREALIVNTEEMPPHNVSVGGFYLRSYLPQRELIESLLAQFGDLVQRGQLKIHTGGVYALRDAAEAHRAMEGRGTAGKLVLVP